MPDRMTLFNGLMLSSLIAGLNTGWIEPNFWFGLGFAAFATVKLIGLLLTFIQRPSER